MPRSHRGWPSDLGFAASATPQANKALEAALRAAGLDEDSPELQRSTMVTNQNRMLDMHRIYAGDDNMMHDRHLHADLNSNNVVDHVYRNRQGKNVQAETYLKRKHGNLTYSNKKLADLSPQEHSDFDHAGLECSCPLCRPASAGGPTTSCPCPVCLPGRAASRGPNPPQEPSAFHPGLRTPKTIEDLMDLLRELKPGKKILQVAGDIDICETKVAIVEIEPGVQGPGVLVACLGGLPDQKRILKDPALNSEWAVGPATADQQRLVLKITKKVHIHVHFVLRMTVPVF